MTTGGNPRQDPYIEHLDFLLSSFTDNGKSLRGLKIFEKCFCLKFQGLKRIIDQPLHFSYESITFLFEDRVSELCNFLAVDLQQTKED